MWYVLEKYSLWSLIYIDQNNFDLVRLLISILVIILQTQWSNVFSGIVSRAMTLEVLSIGVAGNYNGALQVVRTYIYWFMALIGYFNW